MKRFILSLVLSLLSSSLCFGRDAVIKWTTAKQDRFELLCSTSSSGPTRLHRKKGVQAGVTPVGYWTNTAGLSDQGYTETYTQDDIQLLKNYYKNVTSFPGEEVKGFSEERLKDIQIIKAPSEVMVLGKPLYLSISFAAKLFVQEFEITVTPGTNGQYTENRLVDLSPDWAGGVQLCELRDYDTQAFQSANYDPILSLER